MLLGHLDARRRHYLSHDKNRRSVWKTTKGDKKFRTRSHCPGGLKRLRCQAVESKAGYWSVLMSVVRFELVHWSVLIVGIGRIPDRQAGDMNLNLPCSKARGSNMPGDPKQCRLHAMRCAELAATAKTQQLKATLLELAKNWERLAISLERTHSLMDEDSVDFKKPA